MTNKQIKNKTIKKVEREINKQLHIADLFKSSFKTRNTTLTFDKKCIVLIIGFYKIAITTFYKVLDVDFQHPQIKILTTDATYQKKTNKTFYKFNEAKKYLKNNTFREVQTK
jgi:hypothetical protein